LPVPETQTPGPARVRISLRFYAELNGFLSAGRRQRVFDVALRERDSVKDVIEAQGVPHTEVDLVLADGESVGFHYRVADGDRIAVYPAFRHLDVSDETRVRPAPLAAARFVLDCHLGRLAAHLRLLGFDTLYWNDGDDPDLARIAHDEDRILLTRDRGLLKRSAVTRGYHVWATNPDEQIVEVLRRFKLLGAIAPFTRCARCNGRLERVSKAEVLDQLEPKTRLYFDEFARCAGCGQVYWKGSHHGRVVELVEHVRRIASPGPAAPASAG
jgi:uncharacterized protein